MGSERIKGTGASNERFKEGAFINQSLSCLGNCIHALAESTVSSKTAPNKKLICVPYRDSVLTKLLMNALGGNSRTIMVFLIWGHFISSLIPSPADDIFYRLFLHLARLMMYFIGSSYVIGSFEA